MKIRLSYFTVTIFFLLLSLRGVGQCPVADFSNTPPCQGSTVLFTDLTIAGSPSILSWDWNFGDGSTHSLLRNPTHQYADTVLGTFNVTLIVTNSNECVDSISKPLQIIPPPTAAFITNALNCAGAPVLFTDQSSTSFGYILKWTWDFDDGSPLVEINNPGPGNVRHAYVLSGVYYAKLTVETSDHCTSVDSVLVTVTAGPIADFTNSAVLCFGQPVQFADSSQTNGAGPITMWQWNFDDPGAGVNNLSSQPNPSHIFTAAGTHNVTLIITNINSCTDTISIPVEIFPLPVADFDYDEVCLGTETPFTDLSTQGGLPITVWDWDFGDGSAHSTVQNPTHTFARGGTHLVTLTVVNNNGCTNSISRQVTIGAPPVAAFNYISACLGNATKFTDYSYTNSGAPIVSWLWKFNETNVADTSNLQYPVFKYTSQGLYNVTLTVTAASGCPDTITIPVQVFPAPKANFNFIINASCANGAVSFQDSSINYLSAITEWKWEFEPGYISTLKNPYHIFYNTDSSYNVRLVVTDMRGCIDTLAKDVYIPAGLEVEIVDSLACFGVDTWFKPKAPAGDSLIAFQWNFGDLASGSYNTSSLRNPFHHFQTPGSYSVSLVATDTNNCSKTVYHQVDIQELPIPVFSYTQGNCDNT
ncbi:MAG: PKD domain-containing protein, partial [Bacteroidetes bacterium]|nr:PKD domain-containing protein [Bacteroidota bacterium]